MPETNLTLRTNITGANKTAAGLDSITKGMIAMGVAAGVVLNKATSVFLEFDKSVNRVKAFLDPAERTEEILSGITNEAIKIGSQLPLMNAEILEGAVALEKLGFSGKEVKVALEAISLAAVANDIQEVGQVAEIGGDTLRAFGGKAEDMSRFLNVMTKAANSSSQSFTDQAEALKFAGLSMSTAGQDIEETTLLLGLMANNSLKGSMAGTNLRQAISKLAKEYNKTTGNIDGTNVALVDSEGSFRDLSDVIFDLKEEFKDLSEIERLNKLESIAGMRGKQALMAVMANEAEVVDKLRAKIDGANGTLEEMAKIMQEGASGAVLLLTAQMDSFWNKLGKAITVVLEPFIRALADLVGWISKNEIVMSILAGILGGVFLAGITAATAALWFLIAPALPIIAAFAAVGAALSLLATAFDNNFLGIRTAFQAFSGWLVEKWRFITDVILEELGEIIAIAVETWNKISEDWRAFMDVYGGQVKAAWGLIKTIFSVALDVIKVTFAAAWASVKLIFETAWAVIAGAIKIALLILQGDWEGAWDVVKDVFFSVWNSMRDFVKDIIKSMVGFVVGLIEKVKSAINFMKELVGLGDGGFSQTTRTLGNIVKGISPRAHGGPVSSGGSFLVGEEGPEIFTPKVSGNITPNNKIGGITINISGVFGSDAGEEVGDMIVERLQLASAI